MGKQISVKNVGSVAKKRVNVLNTSDRMKVVNIQSEMHSRQ